MQSYEGLRLPRKIAPLVLSPLFIGLLLSALPGATTEKTVAQIVEEQARAVLVVYNFGPGRALQGRGSGFLVRPNGIFVTNFHVVEGSAAVAIKLPDRREFAATGIVALRPDLDLAVLKVEAQGLPVVALGDSDAVKVGEQAVAIGSPMGLENTVSDGLISAIRKAGPGGRILQITSPISPGSSGGPLFNTKGEVVGITFAGFDEGQNLNFAIPINNAKPLIRDVASMAFSPSALAAKEECPVIGNRVSGIYHVRGGQFYARMRRSPNRICFQSEADAVQAGFRRSLR